MKKNIIITSLAVILLSIFMLPSNVNAKAESTNLKEAVDEEIELFKNESSYKEAVNALENYDLSDYKDDKNKVNVYIFRGNTCSHCFEVISHFASIYKESGKYFNVKTYEVWSNTDNNELMEKVAKELDDEVNGVPYIVIGNKSWSGYASSYDDVMMKTIKQEYKKEKSKRNDIVENILNGKSSNNTSSDILAVLIIVLIAGGITYGIIITRKKATE